MERLKVVVGLLASAFWAVLFLFVCESARAGAALSGDPSEAGIRAWRIFSEPLIPVGHSASAAENRRAAKALADYQARSGRDDFSALENFLRENPGSCWAPSISFNLAAEYFNTGWYSEALATWRKTWPQLRNESDPAAAALGDRAAGELAYMLGRLGRITELAELLDEVTNRAIVGSATEKIAGAQEGLWSMRNRPEGAFKCGPFALDRILASQSPSKANSAIVRDASSTTNGCSLAEVSELSRQLGMNFQMAFRSNGATWLLPAVINWKAGHYAALIRSEGGLYLAQDPTFGNDTWISARALEHEASGYFLVPPGKLPSGWRAASEQEGAKVFGKGATSSKDNTATTPADECNCNNDSGSSWSLRGLFEWTSSLIGKDEPPEPPVYGTLGIRGMPVSSVQLAVVGLNLRDNPVGYTPPVGPDVRFVATYNQRDAGQPANFSYANLGPKWTFNWLAYIADNPSSPSADVNFYTEGGGTLPFTDFNSTSQTFAPQMKIRAQLHRISTNSYEMLLADGSKTIFARPDATNGTSRRVFMTQMVDPMGNALQVSYDGSFRVTAVTDAVGQVTTFAYTNVSDPLKITSVTDPFGRSAIFIYDTSHRLASITDPLGMTSTFAYDSGDFIQSMTTPYGTTSFQKGGVEPQRSLVTTYPDGEQDKVEFVESSVIGVPDSDPSSTVPAGMPVSDVYLIYRDTYVWDRNAYAQAPYDYTKARWYHWLHLSGGICSSILESVKTPLENRVWLTYDGQSSSIFLGTTALPNAIGRVLDDGTTQLKTFAYDTLGHLTNAVDPSGRSVSCVYSTNLVDLLEVRQTTGANNELLARFLYNTQHLAVAMWDAAGQMTSNTYNLHGELLATTDPKGETTTFSYDTNGRMTTIDGPLPGSADSMSFTYDAAGRVRTFTDIDSYTITNSYDNFDRVTNVFYPDGTFAALTFDKLDRVKVRDRVGRTTQFTFDALRRLTSVQDPLNRVIGFQYCGCGGLSTVIDPMGRPTHWTYDIQGRVTAKQYADSSQVRYTYENTTSRLKSVQDERGQVKSYGYAVDDDLIRVAYTFEPISTPTVSFTYDPNYHRITSIQDGVGTTTYAYEPVGALGALKPATVTGPWANETVTYQYDELGRMTNRAISGVAQSVVFDGTGRATNVVNALGSFNYDFDGPTARLLDVFYPNGQSSHYDYFDNSGDRRPKTITHLRPDLSVLSRFAYTYNPAGEIVSWIQSLGTVTNTWVIGADAASQLLSVQDSTGGATNNYTYDAAGNRSLESGANTSVNQYNVLNQLVAASDPSLTNATYEWNAAGELTAINSGTARSEFSYDGLGRRSRIVERTNGIVRSERRYAWCGTELCEERDANDVVTRRFFAQGFAAGGTNYFYTRDQLGSIREVTDAVGQLSSRYAYDPFGRRTALLENQPAPFGFTGHFIHAPSGLLLTPTRVYQAGIGRWLSRDPLGEMSDINLYAYTGNDPLDRVDQLGLCWDAIQKELSQDWNTISTDTKSWYNTHLYLYQVESENWLKEHAQELAHKTAEGAEALGSLIKGEAAGFSVVPVVNAVSKDPPALINGIVQSATYSQQLQESIDLVNSDGRTPTPTINGAQKVAGAVSH